MARVLKDLLDETGLERSRREKEQTHTYQLGIRVICTKQRDAGRFQTIAQTIPYGRPPSAHATDEVLVHALRVI